MKVKYSKNNLFLLSELTLKLAEKSGEFIKIDILEEMRTTIAKLTRDNEAYKKINEGTFLNSTFHLRVHDKKLKRCQ